MTGPRLGPHSHRANVVFSSLLLFLVAVLLGCSLQVFAAQLNIRVKKFCNTIDGKGQSVEEAAEIPLTIQVPLANTIRAGIVDLTEREGAEYQHYTVNDDAELNLQISHPEQEQILLTEKIQYEESGVHERDLITIVLPVRTVDNQERSLVFYLNMATIHAKISEELHIQKECPYCSLMDRLDAAAAAEKMQVDGGEETPPEQQQRPSTAATKLKRRAHYFKLYFPPSGIIFNEAADTKKPLLKLHRRFVSVVTSGLLFTHRTILLPPGFAPTVDNARLYCTTCVEIELVDHD